MKSIQKYFIAAALSMPLLASCNQDKIDQLSSENTTLAERNQGLNKELESYLQTFNEIEENLQEIKSREENIATSTSDNVEYADGDRKETVVKDIQAINALMTENKQKINSLQTKLASSDSEFKRMVANLNKRLNDKDQEIIVLFLFIYLLLFIIFRV